jgi:hypothetical protein
MATAPAFAATPKAWCGKCTTGQADLTGATTTNIVTIATGGASGSKIEEIVVQSDGNPADSIMVFALHDGSTYFPFDMWDIGDPAAGSTTVSAYRTNKTYENLVLPTSSWTLRAWVTVTPTSGSMVVTALGADF